MNAERDQLVKEIFADTLEQASAAERDAFLAKACGADAQLRQEVEALLQSYGKAGGFLEEPALVAADNASSSSAPLGEKPGDRIGRYKLVQEIGEGGFGVVYVAEQEEPVRRRVALKVVKPGMDTRAVIGRFEAERQALALMDHPNIAKVFDAGATETGRPYFVMELVQGMRITDYCDQHRLSTTERLELFVQVCHAVQHAHQKGIIHRDLKPSNILVTLQDEVAVPKVIDFGIAKATGGQVLTDKTLYTALDQFLGTPAYTSPEQAQALGADIDTRSDIYNLGVLLYELLTGHTPFEHKRLVEAGLDEVRRIIREEEPARPSTRLSALSVEEQTTVSKRRQAEPPELIHLVRGDLDWIVMKCLEKDRKRRYDTANCLAQDIQCHLRNEPVTARPQGRVYRMGKLIRRNKVAFAFGASIAATLVAGTVVSTWEAVLATRAKGEAVAAHARETLLRRQAEAQELSARQRAYASDMNLAKAALNGNSFGRVLELLNRQRPPPGQKDLRGWEWRYLWQQSRSDALFTLSEEPSTIISLEVSPDGTLLAIGVKHKGGLALWDLRARQEVLRLLENEVAVKAVFSPTEPLLATASSTAYGTPQACTFLRLWNTLTHQKVAQFQVAGRTCSCSRIAFSADGRTLATACASRMEGEGQIALWRVADGTKLASYPLETAPAINSDVSFNRELSLAAYALWDGRVRVIDLRGLKELWTAATTNEFTNELVFSPDGKMLATGAQNSDSQIYGDVRLWDIATGKTLGRMPGHSGLPGHSFYVNALVFWPDGKKLASGSGDETIRIWDLPSQTCMGVLHGLHQEVWELALLPDQRTLVSAGVRGRVCVWDTSLIHPRQPRVTLPETLVCWGFAPDGKSVLAVSREGQVSRWSGPDFQQKQPLLQLEANPLPLDTWEIPHTPLSYLFSQDRRFLATGSRNGALAVWDLSRAVSVRHWTNTTAEVRPLSFLAGADRLVTESVSDNSFHEWDLLTGLEIQRWQRTASACVVALSPDERAVLAVDSEGSIVLRDLRERSDVKMALDIQEPSTFGHGVSYSPAGRLFAAASQLGYARVWETATWQPKATLSGFLTPLGSVAFSPDGARLVTAGSCNTPSATLKLWDADSWQELLTLKGGDEQSLFATADFSPDGSTLGAMDGLGTLYLWLAPSWEEIADADKTAAATGPRRGK